MLSGVSEGSTGETWPSICTPQCWGSLGSLESTGGLQYISLLQHLLYDKVEKAEMSKNSGAPKATVGRAAPLYRASLQAAQGGLHMVCIETGLPRELVGAPLLHAPRIRLDRALSS